MAECQTIEHAVALIHTSIRNTVAGTGKITGAAMTVVQNTMAPMTTCMTGATGSKAL